MQFIKLYNCPLLESLYTKDDINVKDLKKWHLSNKMQDIIPKYE